MAKSTQNLESERGFNVGEIVTIRNKQFTLLVIEESHFDVNSNNVFSGVLIYSKEPNENVGDIFQDSFTCEYTRVPQGSTVTLIQE